MKLIKFSSRPNMKYLVHLVIWTFVQDITQVGIEIIFKFNLELTYLLISFLAEFICGGISYLYQKKTIKRKNSKSIDSFIGIKLIINDKIKIYDSKGKIYFLIIIAAFFDFVEFVIYIKLAPYLVHCSTSLGKRYRGILIIFDAFFYRYILKLEIFKHQRFSLVVLSICLIITVGIEFIFQDVDIFLTYGKFALLLFLLIVDAFFYSLVDVIDKYLFEYDYMNPFKVLMLEGVFGLCFGIGYSIYDSFFISIKKYYDNCSTSEFVYLILSLILYLVLSGVQDTFRAVTTKIYSPMASSLSEFFLNPIYIIFSLFLDHDFIHNNKRNYLYFSLNLLITIIVSICGCVYNEFIILFFWGLQHETYKEISYRAALPNDNFQLYDMNDCEDEESNV